MNEFRPVTKEEENLINFLLKYLSDPIYKTPDLVKSMNDGGMGSLTFDISGQSKHGKNLIEAEYIDSDGSPILITLMSDEQQKLFEIDFFKSDFSALVTYPTPEELKIKSH